MPEQKPILLVSDKNKNWAGSSKSHAQAYERGKQLYNNREAQQTEQHMTKPEQPLDYTGSMQLQQGPFQDKFLAPYGQTF